MEHIYEGSKRKINRTDMRLKRYLFDRINRTDRLIILLGARGTGKTTLQLQYLKEDASSNSVYVSLDDLYFSNHSLVSFAEDFAKSIGIEDSTLSTFENRNSRTLNDNSIILMAKKYLNLEPHELEEFSRALEKQKKFIGHSRKVIESSRSTEQRAL